MPLSLTDRQLQTVMRFAAAIPSPEKRSTYLERIAAMLTTRGRRDDAIVADVAKRAR